MKSKGIERGKNFPEAALSFYRAMVQVLLSDFRDGLLNEGEFNTRSGNLGGLPPSWIA